MYNAQVFVDAGAALMFAQKSLTAEQLEQAGLDLLQSPENLATMAKAAGTLADLDSAEQLAAIVRASVEKSR